MDLCPHRISWRRAHVLPLDWACELAGRWSGTALVQPRRRKIERLAERWPSVRRRLHAGMVCRRPGVRRHVQMGMVRRCSGVSRHRGRRVKKKKRGFSNHAATGPADPMTDKERTHRRGAQHTTGPSHALTSSRRRNLIIPCMRGPRRACAAWPPPRGSPIARFNYNEKFCVIACNTALPSCTPLF